MLPTKAEIRISALMPAFNAEHLIDRALMSISAQTCPVDEVIVVNDGSSDNTSGRVLAWIDRLPVHVVENEVNSGIARSLARGVEACSGNWILRLDADDFWHSGHVAIMKDIIAKPNVVLAASSVRLINDDGFLVNSAIRAPSPDLVRPMLMWDNPLVHSATAFSRDACLKVGNYRENNKWEDYDLWVRLLNHGDFASYGEPTVDYTLSSNSLSRIGRREALTARWQCQRKAMSYFWYDNPFLAAKYWLMGLIKNYLTI